MRRIKPSASGAASARARALRSGGADILSLTLGEPDFPTPGHILDAAAAAMRSGATGYTDTGGTPALKSAIAAKLLRENGLAFADTEIIAGAGCKAVIFHALMTTVQAGDEVIIPAPYWVSYPEMVRFANGAPVAVETSEADGFRLTPAALEAAIGLRTRWLLLNSPGNPSGAAYDVGQLEGLAEVLRRHPHVWVMTDDIYEHILFDGRRFAALAAVAPDLRDRILTVNGLSKAYSMTGWRLGYAAGPSTLIRRMTTLQSQSSGNPCSISQAAGIAALTGPQDLVQERCQVFEQRRDLIAARVNAIPGLSCVKPDGAFYLYVNVAHWLGRMAPPGQRLGSDADVALHLLEHGLAVVHGAAYGLSPFIRLSFAASTPDLELAAVRLAAAAGSLVA